MVLSSSERDDLVRRVEQKLGRVSVRRAIIRDAVERTLGALPDMEMVSATAPASGASAATAIVAAVSTPDLASRLRRLVERAGVRIGGMAVATEGRHTVVTLEVPPESAATLRDAAASLGARFSWRGE
jgi:hypothetical protein